VGLSTLSLNQFAENMSKAEALSAEIASIHKGFQDIGAIPARADSLSTGEEIVAENAGMTRF
jgi:hypothetical protein